MPVTLEVHIDLVAGGKQTELFHHLGKGVDVLAGNPQHNVALTDAGIVGGTVLHHLDDIQTLDVAGIGLTSYIGIDFNNLHSKIATLHVAVALQVACNFDSQIRGDGKRLAEIVAVARRDGRDDADELGLRVDQSTSTIT